MVRRGLNKPKNLNSRIHCKSQLIPSLNDWNEHKLHGELNDKRLPGYTYNSPIQHGILGALDSLKTPPFPRSGLWGRSDLSRGPQGSSEGSREALSTFLSDSF